MLIVDFQLLISKFPMPVWKFIPAEFADGFTSMLLCLDLADCMFSGDVSLAVDMTALIE